METALHLEEKCDIFPIIVGGCAIKTSKASVFSEGCYGVIVALVSLAALGVCAAQRPSLCVPNDFGMDQGLTTLAAKEAREAFEAGRIHQFRALFHLGAVRKLMCPELFKK